MNRLAKLKARAPSRGKLPKQLEIFRDAATLFQCHDPALLDRQIQLEEASAIITTDEWNALPDDMRETLGFVAILDGGKLVVRLSHRTRLDFYKRLLAMLGDKCHSIPTEPRYN